MPSPQRKLPIVSVPRSVFPMKTCIRMKSTSNFNIEKRVAQLLQVWVTLYSKTVLIFSQHASGLARYVTVLFFCLVHDTEAKDVYEFSR